MANRNVIETFYGRYAKYEVVKVSTWLSTEFHIYRDGKHWRGAFGSLKAAAAAAEKAARR